MADDTQSWDDEDELAIPEQALPGEGGSPAAPPDDIAQNKDFTADHPETDTGVDQHEKYDVGEATASGANAQHEDEAEPEERRIG
jgi:hypothetical protein